MWKVKAHIVFKKGIEFKTYYIRNRFIKYKEGGEVAQYLYESEAEERAYQLNYDECMGIIKEDACLLSREQVAFIQPIMRERWFQNVDNLIMQTIKAKNMECDPSDVFVGPCINIKAGNS